MTNPTGHRLSLFAALLVCVTTFTVGCGKQEEVRSYAVPKESQEQVDTVDATDRMMGAILPVGGQTWYFKVAGPTAAMDANAAKITEFFQSIKPAEQGTPTWTLPEGWQEQAGSGMRAATLVIPAEGKPLELTVISLPTTSAPNELLDNVNRWRGQLQLKPIDERGLAETVKPMKVGEATLHIVDERGRFSAGGMTPPFAGGGPFSGGTVPPGNPPFAGAAPPVAPGATPPGQPPALPPGHPPVDDRGGPVDQAANAPFTFTVPAGWKQQPASGFRKMDFDIKDGGKAAEMYVIDLPSSAPSIGNALENINRWRGEIGLTPIKQEQVAALVQKIAVGGKPSEYVELLPDAANPAESQAGKATFAASVPAGDVIWFFKLRGDSDLVIGQRDNFKSFLQSVRFAPSDGAGDGNQ